MKYALMTWLFIFLISLQAPAQMLQRANASADSCLVTPGITRQTYGVVTDVTGWVQRASDMTLFESVWGYTPGQPLIPFPGRMNKQERPYIEKNKYIALKFTVPNTMSMGSYSYFSFGETNPESRYSVTISSQCGDFRDPSLLKIPGCYVSGIAPSGTFLWATYPQGTALPPGVCRLEPGKTYYLNIIQAPLNNLANSYCKKASCGNSIQNGPGMVRF